MPDEIHQFDVCIVCALPEEAKAVINEFSRLCGLKEEEIEEGFSKISHYRYPYRRMTIQNVKKEDLRVQITWLSEKGSIEAISHIQSVLTEFTPRFVAMAGICAGDKRKVQLGDLIIADYAFFYDIGKVGKDEEGREVFEPDGKGGYRPLPHILQYAKMFETWKADVARIPRRPSIHQQRDWLLTRLLEKGTPKIPMIPREELKKNAPAWRKIADKLQEGQEPYLTSELALRDKASIHRLQYGKDPFPYKDRERAEQYISPMGSGSTVRKDDPFEQVRKPVRDTVAIDMEGAAFYKMTEHFFVPSLLVKGVCDYADQEKDDSYHTYASRVSAIYILRFIQKYVTSETMPRGDDHQSQSQAWPLSTFNVSGFSQTLRTYLDAIQTKRKARKRSELTERELADRVGVSPAVIKHWINGYPPLPDITNLPRLVEVLREEGAFEVGEEEEQIRAFCWLVFLDKARVDNLIQKIFWRDRKEDEIPEAEEGIEDFSSRIPRMTRYLPEDIRLGVNNFLIEYLGSQDNPQPFGGRDAALGQLDDWLTASHAHPYLLLYAPAGRGKSALLAHWASQLIGRSDLTVIFFPVSMRFGTDFQDVFFRVLAWSLATVHNEPSANEHGSLESWSKSIAKYIRQPLQGKRQLLLILDGVDEAAGWEFSTFAATRLPHERLPGLRVVISTRTHGDEKTPQESLARLGLPSTDLVQAMELLPLLTEEIRDVLVRASLPPTLPLTGEDLAHIIYGVSEGDPLLVSLYVKELLDPLRRIQLKDLPSMPAGHKAFFERLWQEQEKQWGRMTPRLFEVVQAIRTVLTHALGPVDRESLYRLLPLERSPEWWDIKEALRALRRIVLGDGSPADGYVFSHPKLSEYWHKPLSPSERRGMRDRILSYASEVVTDLNQGQLAPESASPYIIRFYRRHLEREHASLDQFLPLLSDGWKRAWDAWGGLHAGFFDDVSALSGQVRRANKELVGLGRQASYLVTEFHCALCKASRDNGDSNKLLEKDVLSPLLAECVCMGILNLQQATAYAKHASTVERQTAALIALAKDCLEEREINGRLREVLIMAQEAPHAQRSAILLQLAPQLSYSSSLYRSALKMAQDSEPNALRVQAIVQIALHLPLQRKMRVLQDVISEQRPIHANLGDGFKTGRVLAVAALAPHLVNSAYALELQREAWEVALTIEDGERRRQALSTLAASLDPKLTEEAITKLQVKWPSVVHWTWLLASALQFLPLSRERKEYLTGEILDQLAGIKSEGGRARTILALLPLVTEQQRQSLVTTVHETINDARHRAQLLGALAGIEAREDVIEEAYQAAQAIRNDEHRGQALCDLLPRVPETSTLMRDPIEEEAQKSIERIEYRAGKAALLFTLACQVRDEQHKTRLLREALTCTFANNDRLAQMQFLGNVAAVLEREARIGVLDEARSLLEQITTPGLRVKAMEALLPALDGPQQDQAIQALLGVIGERVNDQSTSADIGRLTRFLTEHHHQYVVNMAERTTDVLGKARLLGYLLTKSPDEPRRNEYAPEILSLLRSVGNRVRDQKNQADILEQVADFLPNHLVMEAFKIAQAIPDIRYQVRACTALVGRLPDLEERGKVIDYILDALPTIDFPRYDERLPPHILLTLAPYGHTTSLREEAIKKTEGIARNYQPQAIAEVLPYIQDPAEKKRKAREALMLTCQINAETYRVPALGQLAPQLPILFTRADLYTFWSETLEVLSTKSRQWLLENEAQMVPVLFSLAGPEIGTKLCAAVIQTGRWWQ